jgi:glycosyltransferase involved in cell wall biosynthesis
LVGIPAYNEADSIGGVVSSALPHADDVLVVDDGSADATSKRARRAGATVVAHEDNRGYGAALATLFDRAHAMDVDHLVVLDGDGQHDADDIPKLIETQRHTGAEIVVASRFVLGHSALPSAGAGRREHADESRVVAPALFGDGG